MSLWIHILYIYKIWIQRDICNLNFRVVALAIYSNVWYIVLYWKIWNKIWKTLWFLQSYQAMFWCPFLLRLSRSFAHPNAISQKILGKYTCAVGWVGHVLKNVIELQLSQNTGAVVLLKMYVCPWSRKAFVTLKLREYVSKLNMGRIPATPNRCEHSQNYHLHHVARN